MKHLPLLIVALVALPVRGAQTPSTFALSADGVDNVTVYADKFASAPSGSAIVFTGEDQPVTANIVQRSTDGSPAAPIVILARSVRVDFAASLISADGEVVMREDTHVVNGKSARYNWLSREGHVDDVSFEEYGLSFQASSMDMTPISRVMKGVVFSGCGLVNPDYVLRAASVKMAGARQIAAAHVSLELFHHRVAELPQVVYRIHQNKADAKQNLPVPRPGHSLVSGFTLSQDVPLTDTTDAEIEATTKVGWRGKLLYANPGRVTPYANLEWKQEHGTREPTPVLVSTLPEAGIRFSGSSDGNLSVGYYREHDTGVRALRANLSFDHKLLDHGARAGLRLIVGGRIDQYSTGEAYRTAHVEVSVGRDRPVPEVFEEIGVRLNGLQGHSPFQWDQVQVQTELFAGKRIAWGACRFEWDMRYDLGHRDIYDTEYAVAKRLRCIEPEIRYSQHRQAIWVGLKTF